MEKENLQQENEEMKKIISAKSELLSLSAHQLRTSLSALKWTFKMFLDGDVGELAPEQQALIKKASDSNERMIALVSDILTLNKTDAGTLPYHIEEFNIVSLIDETLFEFIGESYKRGIEIIFLKPDSPIPNISADREKIRVVFENIIENALKYSSKGDKIFISINIRDAEVEIAVKDNGIGIKEDEASKIFTKFFRTSEAEQKDTVGTGLGLFTTKNIVEHHNGKIWFESVSNNGSTFFVTLPIKHNG
ncbi:MAG: HAMP domain-containing sensor histidine kinase [Candidatus Paceibacterota bacterium]|jgi:signal transduction histidine kinase